MPFPLFSKYLLINNFCFKVINHPYHLGDLPNIIVDKERNGYLEAISTRFTLSDGPLCIFNDGGSSIMIHAHKDPYHAGDHGSGVSGGPRMGCGVIKKI
ncbi:MAG: superoxide dismutase family protein [Candidatus Levyibacteriota bacterium]